MLWNNLIDFFVAHVFGGVTTGGVHYYAIFAPYSTDFLTSDNVFVNVPLSVYGQTDTASIPLGNYFAFIASIISIIIIVVLCCLFIKKMVSSVSNLMSR